MLVSFIMNSLLLLKQICITIKHVLVPYNKTLSDIFVDIYVRGTSTYNIGLRFNKCSWFILHRNINLFP